MDMPIKGGRNAKHTEDGATGAVCRPQAEHDLDEELHYHVEQQAEQNICLLLNNPASSASN